MVKEKSKKVITLESLDEKFDRLLRSLDLRFTAIDRNFIGNDQKFEDIISEIQRLDKKIDSKFDFLDWKIDSKVDGLDKNVGARIDKLNVKMMEGFTAFDGKLDSIYEELTSKIAVS